MLYISVVLKFFILLSLKFVQADDDKSYNLARSHGKNFKVLKN